MKNPFKHEWILHAMAFCIIGIYGYVMIYSIQDPQPADDLIVGRVHDLMVWVVGFYFGAAYKSIKSKINKEGK